jgi:hypothetical protein
MQKFEEWRNASVKRRALPMAEARRRYDQYLLSTEGKREIARLETKKSEFAKRNGSQLAKAGSGSKASTPKGAAASVAQARANNAELAAQYYTHMISPFTYADESCEVRAVPFPDFELNHTVNVQLIQRFKLSADTNGNAMVFVRPGVDLAIAHTGAMSDYNINWEQDNTGTPIARGDLPSILTGWGSPQALNTFNKYWYSTDALDGCYAVQDLQNQDDSTSVREQFSAYRVTACGVRLNYIGAPLTAKGEGIAVPWKGTYGVPSFTNSTLTLGGERSLNSGGASSACNFDNLMALDGVIRFDAVAGVTAHWVPTGIIAASDFRPTKYVPSYLNLYAIALFAGQGVPVFQTALEQLYTPAAFCNSEQHRAFYDSLFRNHPIATCNTGSALLSQYDNISIYGVTVGNSGTVPEAQESMLRVAELFELTTMSEGDAGIVIFVSGLPASTYKAGSVAPFSVIDVEQVCYEVEIVTNIECILDRRTLAYNGGAFARSSLASPSTAPVALAAAKLTPIAHPGGSTEASVAHTSDWINTVGGALATGTKIVAKVAPAAEAASSVGDWLAIAGEVLGALFL